VVRPGLDPATKERLRKVFLEAHLDKDGADILKGMMIERFLPIEDSAYDSIREMKTWIAAQKSSPSSAK
jgi:phosphonate transport system substrate-binding protein